MRHGGIEAGAAGDRCLLSVLKAFLPNDRRNHTETKENPMRRHRQRLGPLLASSTALALIAFGCGGPPLDDTGLLVQPIVGGASPFCTWVAEDWKARCAAGLGQTSRCAALTGAASEADRE